MPAVFVHGVPDTYRVWDTLKNYLTRHDIEILALPGFGTPVPEGFAAAKEEYVSWIVSRLEAIGEPVDLVGHDWGCILTMRVASLRPDLIRSWAAGSGPVSPQYEWHSLAKIWQSPGEGESWMQQLKPFEMAAFMAAAGLPKDLASENAERIDGTMKESVLRLYRSALKVGAEWQPDLSKARSPGLVFWGRQDSACPARFAYDLGRDTSANQVLTFECGHWVIVQRAAELARALEAHWATCNSNKENEDEPR